MAQQHPISQQLASKAHRVWHEVKICKSAYQVKLITFQTRGTISTWRSQAPFRRRMPVRSWRQRGRARRWRRISISSHRQASSRDIRSRSEAQVLKTSGWWFLKMRLNNRMMAANQVICMGKSIRERCWPETSLAPSSIVDTQEPWDQALAHWALLVEAELPVIRIA